MWEELICVYDGSFVLFNYAYLRNSYVSFGTIKLSMYKELIYEFCYVLFYDDNQHIFYI